MPMTARVKYFGTFVKCGVLVDYMIRLPDTKPTDFHQPEKKQIFSTPPDIGFPRWLY